MKLVLYMVALVVSITSYNSPQLPQCGEQADFQRYFDEAGVYGTFVLYNPRTKTAECHNSTRADSSMLPASTFKIFSSLVALETKAVASERDTLPWDGVRRNREELNKSQDMREAYKNSTVWFYQELARRIGREKMKHYIDASHYGNQNINGQIDMFWLNDTLRISARQQIAFLQQLHNNTLPFSQRTIDIVKEVMVNERRGNAVLRAKTGWGDTEQKQIGWWVGYVEKGGEVWYFALNIDLNTDEDGAKRKTIVRRILADRGIFPQ